MSAAVTDAGVKSDAQSGFITLGKARHLPMLRVDGKSVDVATMWRWSMRGVRGHKLRATRIGNRLCTTVEWIEMFIEQLSNPDAAPDTGEPPRQREEQIKRAEAETAELDIPPNKAA